MDRIQSTSAKKLTAIKKLVGDTPSGNVKFLLKGKNINDLDPETDFTLINKIFNLVKPNNLQERIKNIVTELLDEKLCPKGEKYRQSRLDAGEKSSFYLSGRASKICKGQMNIKSKK